MRRFIEGVDRQIEGVDRQQRTLFPECLEDWICEDNPVRVIDAFVEKLDLESFGSTELLPKSLGGLRTIRRCC